jgi:sugar phosphate isomerase/epimerase
MVSAKSLSTAHHRFKGLSLAYLTIPGLSPVEAVKVASAAGFDRVGLRFLPAVLNEQIHPIINDEFLLVSLIAALSDSNMHVGDVELIRINADIQYQDFRCLFELLQRIGVQDVTVVNDDDDMSRVIDSFGRLCEQANKYGLFLNLEPIPWTALKDLKQAQVIVESVGQNNAGILLDSFHFYRRPIDFEVLASIPKNFLRVVQISDGLLDYDPNPLSIQYEARNARLLPGQGEFNLRKFVSYLPDHVMLSVEAPNRRLQKEYLVSELASMAMDSIKNTLMDRENR